MNNRLNLVEPLHHAYFLIGSGADIRADLLDLLEKNFSIERAGNPDMWHNQFNTLTIEHAREIALRQQGKSFGSGKKIFIIEAETVTEEAQNALLKVFEEPTVDTHFFLISPQDILLPTLRSRMAVIRPAAGRGESSSAILDKGIAERLALVKDITEGIGDEEKTKQDAIAFLNTIETELYSRGLAASARSLQLTEKARAALYDRGAPIKMILEHVVLSI